MLGCISLSLGAETSGVTQTVTDRASICLVFRKDSAKQGLVSLALVNFLIIAEHQSRRSGGESFVILVKLLPPNCEDILTISARYRSSSAL